MCQYTTGSTSVCPRSIVVSFVGDSQWDHAHAAQVQNGRAHWVAAWGDAQLSLQQGLERWGRRLARFPISESRSERSYRTLLIVSFDRFLAFVRPEGRHRDGGALQVVQQYRLAAHLATIIARRQAVALASSREALLGLKQVASARSLPWYAQARNEQYAVSLADTQCTVVSHLHAAIATSGTAFGWLIQPGWNLVVQPLCRAGCHAR